MSNNKKRSELSKSQQLSLYYKVQKLVDQVNDSALPERQVAFGTALEVANREIRKNVNGTADARMYSALRAVSAFASLATKNKVTTASLQNSDFLSVGHPLSTKLHYMDEASLRHARAQWIAADSHITNEGVRSLVASAHSLEPGSLERKHAFARLTAMGPGLVPITAAVDLEPIVAAFGFGLGGNSRAARSARARMQRRDRKGRFAYQGGSWNFSVRFPDGAHRSVTGKVVGASGVDDIEVEVRDNKYVSNGVYAVPASRGIAAKATVPKRALKGLPDRDVEVSAEQRKYSIESSSLKRMESPSAWKKIQSADPNTATFMTDDGYRLDVPATDTGAPDFSGINRGKLHRAVGNQMISNSIDGWDQAEKTALMDQDNYDKYLSTPQGQKQLSQGGWGVDVVQEEITDSPFKSAFDRKAPGDRPGPVPPSVQRLVDAENERRAADEKTSAPALLDEPRGELAPTQSVRLNWQTEDGPVDQEGLDAWTQEFSPGVTAKLMDDGSVRMSGTEDNLRNAIDKATDGDYNASDYIMDSAKLESYGRPTAPVTVETPGTKPKPKYDFDSLPGLTEEEQDKILSRPVELRQEVGDSGTKPKAPFDVEAMKKSVEGITHQKLATGPTEYEMIGDFGPAWFTEDDVYDAKKDGYRETGRQRGGNRMQTYRRYADPSGEVSDFNDATWEEKKNSIRKARANGDLLNFSYNGKNRQVQPGNVYVNKKTGGTNIVTFDHAAGEERTYDVNKMKAPIPAKAKAAEAPRIVDAASGKEPQPITSTNLQDVVGDVQKAIDGQYPISFDYSGKNRVFRPERMYTNPKTGTTNVVGFSETDGEGRTFIAEKMTPSEAPAPAPTAASDIIDLNPKEVNKIADIKKFVQDAVDNGQSLRFTYSGKDRIVTPQSVWQNGQTGRTNLKATDSDGTSKNFAWDKIVAPDARDAGKEARRQEKLQNEREKFQERLDDPGNWEQVPVGIPTTSYEWTYVGPTPDFDEYPELMQDLLAAREEKGIQSAEDSQPFRDFEERAGAPSRPSTAPAGPEQMDKTRPGQPTLFAEPPEISPEIQRLVDAANDLRNTPTANLPAIIEQSIEEKKDVAFDFNDKLRVVTPAEIIENKAGKKQLKGFSKTDGEDRTFTIDKMNKPAPDTNVKVDDIVNMPQDELDRLVDAAWPGDLTEQPGITADEFESKYSIPFPRAVDQPDGTVGMVSKLPVAFDEGTLDDILDDFAKNFPNGKVKKTGEKSSAGWDVVEYTVPEDEIEKFGQWYRGDLTEQLQSFRQIETPASSSVEEISFDPASGELLIKFKQREGKGGGIYLYPDVDPADVSAIENADSIGSAVGKFVKGRAFEKFSGSQARDWLASKIPSSPRPTIDGNPISDYFDEEARTPRPLPQTRPEVVDTVPQVERRLNSFYDADGNLNEAGKAYNELREGTPEAIGLEGDVEDEISTFNEEAFDSMFVAPQGAYKPDVFGVYRPTGRTDQASPDYTDDPEVLANKFDPVELADAAAQGIGDGSGRGQLEFEIDKEDVPVEALLEALEKIGIDKETLLSGFYERLAAKANDPAVLDAAKTAAKDMAKAVSDDPNASEAAKLSLARAVQLNGELGAPGSTKNAEELVRGHVENNPYILKLARDIENAPELDEINRMAAARVVNQYLPWAFSDDPAQQDAFRAYWGMLMLADGGDKMPWYIEDEENFSREMALAIGQALGGTIDDGAETLENIIDIYGDFREFANGRKRISEGVDDLSAKTTAAALYRLTAELATPSTTELQRYIYVDEGTDAFNVYTTEGIEIAFDPRSFSSINAVTDPKYVNETFAVFNSNRRKLIFKVPPGEIDAFDAHNYSWLPQEKEHIGYGKFKIEKVEKISNLTYSVELSRAADERTQALDTAKTATPQSSPAVPYYGDISRWEEVAGPRGSNQGGIYEDENGRQYYVKEARSQSHAENEALASAFYRFFGIPSSEVGLATLDADKDSEPGTYNPSSMSAGSDRIVTPMIPGAEDTLDDFRSDSKITSQLHDGFAVDAWLSNYDVIGLEFDNIVVDDNGNTYRIDPGGALKWRARGSLKTWFGPQVAELEDLRSYNQYPQAAAVFSAMTPEQIVESGRKLLNITPSQIDDIVSSVISDSTDREMLKDILKRRRSDVLSKLGISDTTTDPFADRVPLTESIGYEAQDLQSGDVIGDDSFVIERIFRDGETPKGKVSVQGYFPGHESQRKEWNETTIIPAARGGTIPPKGDKPALHRPSAPRKPSPGAFNGKMAELLKDAKTWEEAAAVIRSTPIVYFDYETTGLPGPEKGGKNMPVQIGAVVVKDGAVVDRFSTYMNPEHELSDWSAGNLKQLDGSPVTEEWLAERPSMKVAHEQFISFVNNAVGDSVILGGQYTPFDLEILNRVLGEQGLSLDIAGTIDSKDLAQGTLPKWNSKTKIGASQVSPKDGKRRASNSLGPVADFLEVQLPDWHRADADAEASWEITDAMLNRAIENPDTTPTTLLNVDGAYAAKQKELTDYEKAYAKYEADLAEYVAAKAIAAAWNCGGSGLTAAVGAANGPCSVPDIEKMVREATPLPIGEIDPEGVEGGSTSSPTSMADAKEIDDPKHDGVDTNDPYKDEPFMPTEEQRTILDAILSGDDVVVEALAGTGKTSTLLLAGKRKKKERPTERGIYLAFNKSAQLEAERKFADAGLTNIEVATNDAISYRWAPDNVKQKMKRLSKTNPLAYYKKFAEAFGITEFEGAGGATVTLFEATKFFKDVVNKFMISADDEIGSQHFAAAGFSGDVPNWMMAIANNIWNDYQDPNGNAKINNTVVTKMWALSKPDLSKIGSGTKFANNFIFFDEAQDINPVSGRVIGEQQLQVVYVGDNNQAIYAFRGGENQLEKVDREVRRLPLTKSFRFGENIAKEANKWLQLLGTDLRVIGAGSDPGTVVPTGSMLDTTNAILVRTNGGGFSAIADQLGRGRKVGVTKNYKGDLVSLTDTAEYLITGNNKPSQLHEDLAPFKAWPEVQKAIEDDLIDSKKLQIFAQMIDAEGIPGIREMINQLRLVKGSGEISDRSEDDTQVDIGDVAPGASGELGKGITYTVTESAVALSGNTYANKDAIKGTNRFKYNGATKTWDAPSTNEADTFDLLNGLSSALGLKTADPEAPDDGKIDVMITTVHQAKGLEWDSVVAWDDFWGPRLNKATGEVEMPEPTELKIAYVAVTRAKKQVDLGPLNWIDSFVKPDAPAEEEVSAPAQEPTAEGEDGGGIEVPPAPTPTPAEGEDDNERIVKSVKQAVKDADALLEEYADRGSKDEKNIKKFREAVKDALFAYDGELYVDTEEKFREAAEFLEPYAEVGAGDLQSLMLQAADAADAVRISKLTPTETPAPRPKLDPEWRPDDVAAPQGAMPTGVTEAPDSVLPDADAPKTAQQEAEEKNKAFRSDATKAADLQQKFDEFNEAVELVTGEDTSLKTSDRKRVRDAAAKVDAIRKALADGSVSEENATTQLNSILDEFPHKPADSAIAIDINFFRDMLEGITDVLTGQYYWRPTGKSLPPLDAVDSTGRPVGYSRDGKTFITPGMRVRDKWGYSGTVEGYNEKDWINVFIRYDIDPRNPADVKKGNWGPGVARKSMNPSTLTVLSPEDDTDPWIDLPSTPASKKLPTEILEKQKKDWAKLKAARDYEAAARAAELKGEEAPPMPAGLALMTPSADLVRDSKKTKANISSYFDDSYDDQDVADATNDFSLSKNEQIVASDAVITTTDSNGVPMVLMISREYGPFKGAHALPGGFRDGGESFEATADREMMEEVGISADQATSRRYLGEVDSNDWDPRAYKGAYVGAVAYEVPMDTPLAAGDDATGARWVSIPDIIKGFTPVAFGHATWLAEAYKGTKYEAPLRALVKASKERNARLISQINAIREQKGFPTFDTPTLEVWTPVYPEGGGEQGGDLPKADAPSGAPVVEAPTTDIGFDQVENSYKSAGFTSESTGLPSEGLIDYITYGTEDINGYLRAEKEGDSAWEPEGAGQDEIEKYVKQIDNIIDEAPTFDAPVTVYRGTVSKKDKVPKEGETIESPEYLSTSLSPFVAEDFTRLDRHFSKNDIDKGYAKDTVPVIYEIEISPGEKFLSVPNFLPGIDSTLAENEEFADKDWAAEGKNGQQEIIIARDSEIKVLEVATRDDGAILVKASLAKKAKAQNDTDEYSEVQPIDDVGSFLSKIEKQYKKPDGIGMADIDFDDDAMAFAQYRSGIASAVNSALSSGQIGGMQETINRLDRFIDRAPTIDDDILVYRGVNDQYTGANAFKIIKPGETFVSKTFTSASLLERVASNFATIGGGDGMIIEIVIPKNNKIKGIYPDPFAGVEIVGNEYDEEFINNTEAELVLPRDMRFSVVSNDGKRLRVVAVGPDQLERFKDLRETLGQPDENSVDKYPEVEFSEFVALAKDYMQKGKVAYETKKLTKKDWARIQSYFGFDSIAINSSLREGKKLWLADSNDTVENAITSIDKVFEAAAAELPNNSTVFRGVFRRQGDFLKSLKPGDTFVDKGYMSTSISSDLARKFTNTDEQATILRIEVPAGTKVIPNYVAVQAGQETAEKEFLLPRGLRFEVTSIEEADTPNKEYEFLPQKYTVVSVRAVPQRFEYTIGKSYWNFFVANGGLTTLEGVFDSKDQAFYEVNTGSVPKASVKVRLNQKEFVSLYEKVQNDRSLYEEGSDSSSISAAVYKSLLATQSTLELLDSPNYRAKFEPDNSEENAATLGNNAATPDLREEGRGAAPDGTPNDNELIEMFLDGLENPASEFVSRWAAGFSKYERGSDPEAESVADVLNGGMSLLKFDELTKDNEFAQNLYAGVTIFTISYASNAQSMQGIPDIRTDWSLKNKPTLLDPTNVGARSFWYDVAKYLYSPELLDGPITPASALLRAVRAAKPLNKTFERFLKFDELPITDQDHPFNGLLAVGQEIELRPASWTLAENLGVLEMVQDARTVGSPSNPDDVKASQENGHVVLRVEGVSALDISNISQIPEELEHIVSNGKYVVSNVEEIFDENVSFEDSFTRYIRVTLSPVLSEQAPTPKPKYDPSDISTWPSELLDDEGITDPRAALNIIDTAFALLFDPKSTSKDDERAGALYFATMDALRKGMGTIGRKIEEANLRGKSYLDVPGSQTNMKALNEIKNSLGTEMETSTVFSNYYYGAEKYAQDQSDPDSSPSIADTLAQMDALRQRPSRWAKKQSNFRKGSAKLASGAINSPGAITPAGRPPVVTSNPLPLTSSGFSEIMSLSSAIEIVRNKKENDGILGASALVDSTDIEDLDVHVNLINDLEDGEKKLRLRFKLTPWAMLRKQTELADSKEKIWSKNQYVLRRTSLTDTGEIEVHGKAANPIGVYDRAGAEWTYLSEDVGGKADIRIVSANIADLSMDLETNYSSGAPASFHGQVTIDLKLDSTLEDVADALRLAGVGDVRSAERADVDVFIENRLISLFYSQTKSHINVKGQAQREFLLDQLYKKWGVKAEDIALSTGAHGRVDYVFPDDVARKIADSIDTTHFVHNISLVKVIDEVLDAYRYPTGFGSGTRAGLQDSYGRGQTPEAAVIDAVSSAIAAILKRGLLSTVTRFNEGLPYKGMSTSEDIYTGGADSSFLTPRESLDGVEPFKSGTEYLGTGTVLFDPMNVIRRTDVYANTYDSYGKRIEGSDTLRNLQPNNYETLVRHGIDVVAPGNNIILNGKIRERILDMFAEEGITEINGVRLEDFMIADTPLIREPNEYSAEVAADLAEVIKDAGGNVSAVTYKELSALMQLSGAPFMYPYMPPNSTIVAISYEASGAADTSPEEDDNLDIAQVPRLYVLHPNGTAYAVEGTRVGKSGGMLLIDRSELDDLAENLSFNKLSPILQKTGNAFLNKTGSYDTNWTGKITIPAGQPSSGVDVEYKKSPKSYDEYAEYIDSVYKEIEEDVTNNPTLATEAAYLKMFSSLMTLYVSDIGGIADKNGRSLRGLITSRLLDIRNHILKYPQDTPVVSSIDTQELWPVDYDRFMLDGNYVNTLRGNVVIEELDGENAGNIRPVNYVGVIPKVDDLTVVSTQVLIETNRQGRGQYDLDPGTSLVIDPTTHAMQFSSRGIRYIVRALRPSNKKQTQERA